MYEYDDAGRLVRAVTRRESEFTAETVTWMLAARRHRASLGRHGIPMDEAMDPQASPSVRGGWTYSVPPPARDFAQQAINTARDAYKRQYPDADLDSLEWRVERVDPD